MYIAPKHLERAAKFDFGLFRQVTKDVQSRRDVPNSK